MAILSLKYMNKPLRIRIVQLDVTQNESSFILSVQIKSVDGLNPMKLEQEREHLLKLFTFRNYKSQTQIIISKQVYSIFSNGW